MAVLKGTSGANKLVGGDLADTISGLAGSDTLVSNGGSDTLLGGDGNDLLLGGAGSDVLKGEKGNDILKGGAGADKMYGGAGNDKYYVDSTGDRVNEGTNRNKADTIYTTVSINIATAAFGAGQIEQVILQGTKAINATGNSLNNTLVGNSAANALSGGGGADRLLGGGGNDVLVGGGGSDSMDGGAGDDLMIALDGSLVTADGGIGTDTLRFTGSNLNIDFGIVGSLGLGARSTIAAPTDSVGASGLEIIDIIGGGANQLNLDKATLQAITGGNPLTIIANADDTVTLGFTLDPTDVIITGTTDVLLDGPVLALSKLDGFIGFRLDGESANDGAGYSAALAGDVNGDGFGDIIIGAPFQDLGGAAGDNIGAAYVVFGFIPGSTPASSFNLSDLDGKNGFRIDGVNIGDNTGISVCLAGDVNGDGFGDVIIGVDNDDEAGSERGAAYVIFGKADGSFPAEIDLASLSSANGFKIKGVADFDYTGASVCLAGDVNGDGFDDLIIGAQTADPNSLGDEGAAYVVFGKATGFGTFIDLAALDGKNGFRIDGEVAGDEAGISVALAGDVNGDGFGDVIVGAQYSDVNGTSSGAAYVVFGKDGGFAAAIDLVSLNGINGFRLVGSASKDYAGFAVGLAGDINGDGYDDIVVGAHGVGIGGLNSGSAYVVFGKATGFAEVDLGALDGTSGFQLVGAGTNDYAGTSVAPAGDLNGDGFDDVVVGAYRADGRGAAYVVFGKADWSSGSTILLSTLDGANGFRLDGVTTYDYACIAATAGDLDGDGFDDLIVGAPFTDADIPISGAAYVVYGNDFRLEAGQIGTAGADTINGTVGAEILNGAQGNDTIYGAGGADAINGGSGDDSIVVNDRKFFRVDGGGGVDTLLLDFNGVMNFGYIDGNPFNSDWNKITGIEIIDVANGFANNLILHKADLLDMNCQAIAVLDDITLNNVLVFNGDDTDTLALFTSDNWAKTGTKDNFDIYASGEVRIAVDIKIDVTIGADPVTAFDLSTLNGANGFRFDGAASDDQSGKSVSNAGDINGDGFDDFIIGAWRADPGGTYSGAAYVVFGGAANLEVLDAADGLADGNIDLSQLNGTNGFRLDGSAMLFESAGNSVSSAGDVNGDGFEDLIVGAFFSSPGGSQSGAAYVVFGKADWSGSDSIDLSTLGGTNGFRLDGAAAGHYAGNSVSAAGDVNGDGYDDLIVAAYQANSGGGPSGVVYVVFGAAGGFDPTIDLSTLDGTNGYRLDGESTNDQMGKSVSSAGDINGDGFSDLVIGAWRSGPGGFYSGAAYVVFGGTTNLVDLDLKDGLADGNVDMSQLNGTNGFQLNGAAAGHYAGNSVSSAGDINGDGYDDLIIGAYVADFGGALSGTAYVVFGAAGGFASTIDLSALDGTNGFRLGGALPGDQVGASVSSAGDVNGDGFDDLIVSAPVADPGGSGSGAVFLIFGAAGGFTSILDLSSLGGVKGIRLDGVSTGDNTGNSVSSAGDVNGDGFDDLIAGGSSVDVVGFDYGASYVIYGGDFRTEVTELGTVATDIIDGTVSAEILNAAQGNDTITGGGGADAINGGSGNDAIHVSSGDFFRVDGGSGTDTLFLDYGGAIDFGNLDGAALTSDRGRISDIEVIDVTNAPIATLALHKADVLDIDCQVLHALGDPTLDNVLVFEGEVGDTMTLAADEGWTRGVTVAGHDLYFTDNVRIAVDQEINVTILT